MREDFKSHQAFFEYMCSEYKNKPKTSKRGRVSIEGKVLYYYMSNYPLMSVTISSVKV